jgi:hypothetical protein
MRSDAVNILAISATLYPYDVVGYETREIHVRHPFPSGTPLSSMARQRFRRYYSGDGKTARQRPMGPATIQGSRGGPQSKSSV